MAIIRETMCARCGRTFPIPQKNPDQRYCSRTCAVNGRTYPSRPIAPRFWKRVAKTDDDGCWVWMGARNDRGYGQISENSHPVYAHRVSWELHYGAIPDGLWVLHRCDNPSCVRPDHLFLGTHDDNMRDMASKGRTGFQQHPEKAPRGEQHFRTHIIERDVRVIRLLHARGVSKGEIARLYELSRSSVSRILERKVWGHVK